MANTLLPPEEQNLKPTEVAALDRRREFGFTLQIISAQFLVIGTVLCLWLGQDLTYSPGWQHPIGYYFALAVAIVLGAGGYGAYLRRGSRSF